MKSKTRSTTIAIISIIFGLVAMTAVAAWTGLLGDRTSQFQLGEWIGDDPELQAEEATEELCHGQQLDCVEAFRTNSGDFLRFPDTGSAMHWEVILGDDGRRWETVVLDMRHAQPSFEQKRYAIDVLFSSHSW